MRLEPDTGRRLLFALGAALLLVCAAPAQAQVEGQKPQARKISEYVNEFTSCNAGAHLDNFAIELQKDETATGYLIVYGPPGPDKRFGQRMTHGPRNYLVNSRGIDEPRIKAFYAGHYRNIQEVLVELWLVPEGAALPPTTKYEPDFSFEGKFFETGLWDGSYMGADIIEGWGSKTEVALVGMAEMLQRRKNASVYLVAYHDAESAPGTWRRAAERKVESLRGYGVPAERLKVIFGGYAKEPSLQGLIQASDAPPPAKEKRERRPERSMQIANLTEDDLRYNKELVFKGLVDVLKADPQLMACLVVRPGPAKMEDADPDKPVVPNEPPAVDVLQLAEKWKAEFKKNGIGEHKLIVMVIPTRELQWDGELEAWVVPPGAPLPDPSDGDVVNTEEEEAENP